MSIVEAEDFIDSFPDLSEEHKVHLKTLLDRNVVFPNTILGRTLESLRGVVSRNPLPVSGSLPGNFTAYSRCFYFELCILISCIVPLLFDWFLL